jgi:hypothetical protein
MEMILAAETLVIYWLSGAISQKVSNFITTSARTSDSKGTILYGIAKSVTERPIRW